MADTTPTNEESGAVNVATQAQAEADFKRTFAIDMRANEARVGGEQTFEANPRTSEDKSFSGSTSGADANDVAGPDVASPFQN